MSIQVRDITHIYNEGLPDETRALINVSVDAFDGEIVGVIGHTGSGKSTLAQHLNGLLKPDDGSIMVDGMDITAPGVVLRDVRRKVGLVFQYPEYQLFEDTVAEDVAFGPKNLGMSQAEIDIRVRESLKTVDLDYDEIKDRSPFDLSGGQKRRVAIAGVLAMDPHVLVLDEPMAGLDPESHADIVRMIKSIHENQDRIIILISHNMADVAALSDRVVMMDRGQVVSQASPAEIFSKREILKNAGLDVPPVTRMMYGLKERGLDVRTNVFDIDEAADVIADAFTRKGGEARD